MSWQTKSPDLELLSRAYAHHPQYTAKYIYIDVYIHTHTKTYHSSQCVLRTTCWEIIGELHEFLHKCGGHQKHVLRK